MELSDDYITLRWPRESDAPMLSEAVRFSYPELEPYMAWAKPDYADHDALAWIRGEFDPVDCSFLIFDPDGRFAGVISNIPRSELNRTSEIGYWLRSDATGRGLMTAAVRLVLDWGFREARYRRTIIQAADTNRASQAVAERVGAVHEGLQRQAELIRSHIHDVHLYSVLANEFDESLQR